MTQRYAVCVFDGIVKRGRIIVEHKAQLLTKDALYEGSDAVSNGDCDEGAMRGVVFVIADVVGMPARLVSLRRRHASVMPLTVYAFRAIR